MIYFDNAATSFPKPRQVYKSVLHTMKHAGGNAGRGGHDLSNQASEIIYECRERVCELFHIFNTMEICFVNNATTALNYAIKGVLKPGDHVVISALEHNSVLRPVAKLAAERNVEYTIVPADEEGTLEPIENYVKENTRLIAINHASNVLGTIAPIQKIGRFARENGILFLVDASQSAGHLEIDVEEDCIDLLACAGHKGLFGQQGTGILFVRSDIPIDTIIEGGTGSMSQMIEQPLILPDRFESGTLNCPGISGLSAGIDYLLDKGVGTVRAHEQELTKQLIEGLNNIKDTKVYGTNDARRSVGVVSFNLGNWDSVNLCSYLNEKYHVMLRGGLHCSYLSHKTAGTLETGTARVSIGDFNTGREVEKFLNIIDTMR